MLWVVFLVMFAANLQDRAICKHLRWYFGKLFRTLKLLIVSLSFKNNHDMLIFAFWWFLFIIIFRSEWILIEYWTKSYRNLTKEGLTEKFKIQISFCTTNTIKSIAINNYYVRLICGLEMGLNPVLLQLEHIATNRSRN